MQQQFPIRIVGIGSPHGDDQFGWLAAEYLRQSAAFQAGYGSQVEILTCSAPINSILDEVIDSRALIVLDAVVSGSKPGTVMRIEEEVLPEIQVAYSSHGISVAQVIELGRSLDVLPKHVVLLGVELESCESGAPVGQVLERSLERVEQLVVEEIEFINCYG